MRFAKPPRTLHQTKGGNVRLLSSHILMLTLGLSQLGCVHSRQVTWKLKSPEEMQQIVRDHVPLGTAATTAQEFMEAEGFHCEVRGDATFCERRAFNIVGQVHDKLDFIECKRHQRAGHILMARLWTVALVLENDVVADVLVAHYIDGP